MERKLASIQRILSLSPIEGADKIVKATILGWEVVVATKDNFRVGDLVVYCEIDSILPDRPEFEFLRDRKFRIRTIKLKGQVSQGICFPLDILPNKKVKEGDDVTEMLGVKKHDPQAEQERIEMLKLQDIHKNRMDKFLKRYSWYRRLIYKPKRLPFPSFIKKTDEDRIQLFPNACEDWKHLLFNMTEKIDGQSATYFVIENPKKTWFGNKWKFGVCSRNFQLIQPDNSSYWTVAKHLSLKDKMISWCKSSGNGLIIQGEIIGNKVQGNKYGVSGYDFFVFNMSVYEKGVKRELSQEEQSIAAPVFGLKTVPILPAVRLLPSIPEMVEAAKGYSVLANIPREGLVFRNYPNKISFKVINPDFLLKYSE